MLTGQTPFEGNLAALSYAHVHTPAPRVRSIDPAVSAGMDELVAAMLEKDPADRPQTGEDVRRSLDAAIRHAAVTQTAQMKAVPPDPTRRLPVGDLRPRPSERPRPSVRPRRSVWAWVAIPLGLLAIIVLIALLARTGSDGRTNAAQPSTPGGSPTTEQPPPEEPAGLSPEEAAGLVFQTVSDGVEAGEVTDDASKDILHQMDEILRDLDKEEDVEKAIEKLGGLREKVSEALEKGEITSAARASAIDDALLRFAAALGDAEE
jgi:serine/threonine-protein kinase